MLRQALSEAEERQSGVGEMAPSDRTMLARQASDQAQEINEYGSLSQDIDAEDDFNGYSGLSFDSETMDSSEVELTTLQSIWKKLKEFCKVVLDVEDPVWDSPHPLQTIPRRRNVKVVMFWFSVLAAAYAMERVSFKLLVDRLGPFRLLGAEVIATTHATFVALGMLISAISRRHCEMKSLGVPISDVGCK